MPKTLSEHDFQEAATVLACDVPAIKAVAKVESRGSGFLPTGEPIILFEAHVFGRLTGWKYNESHPTISSRSWNRALYKGGAGEYDRLTEAMSLDAHAAQMSASWGMFQIMGFNHKLCGFKDLPRFVSAMYADERAHLLAFCEYIIARNLDDELQRHDWASFANGYNGPEYHVNRYDEKLEKAYASFR